MATFYVLPSRPLLGQRFGEFLAGLFPGLSWEKTAWPDLAESLAAAAGSQPGIFVVFREDLPAGEPVLQALADDFGAELGDEVIEVPPGFQIFPMDFRRWRLAG